MWSDSYGYDSESSDGEPCLTLKEEVRIGDYFAVEAALEAGSNPNDCDDDNYTLLHWAAGMTDPDNLDEVNAKSRSNLNSRRRIVTLLLDRGAIAWHIWWRQEFFGNHEGQRVWDLTTDKTTIICLKKTCVSQVIGMIRDSSSHSAGANGRRTTSLDLSTEGKCSGLIAAALLNMVDE